MSGVDSFTITFQIYDLPTSRDQEHMLVTIVFIQRIFFLLYLDFFNLSILEMTDRHCENGWDYH